MNLIYINNLNDLMEDLSKYREMFPESYTRYSEIKETLFYRQNDPMGSTFGISVAKQWADRCYGFELDRIDGKLTFFQYLGTWKT